jgi:hypothetical protein
MDKIKKTNRYQQLIKARSMCQKPHTVYVQKVQYRKQENNEYLEIVSPEN